MKYIEIKLTKCVVFLTVEEINQLLQRDPDLFVKGLRRGKDILRYRKQKIRESNKEFKMTKHE